MLLKVHNIYITEIKYNFRTVHTAMQSDNIITRVILLDTVLNQSIGFMNTGMYVCTCVCIFACVFVCVYVYVCVA